MADIILSIDRELEERVVEHLSSRGEGLGWFYRGSLSDRLPETRSRFVLRDLAYRFHRVEVEDGREDSEVVRIALLYDSDRTGRVIAERNHQFSYSSVGLPFNKGGKHASYLSTMKVSQAWAAGVTGNGVPVAVIDSGQDGLGYGGVKDYYDVENAKTALHPSPPVPIDRDGHGTAMSTLIRDVAPDAEIYIVRISDQSQPLLWNMLAGLAVAAYDCQAEILNLSIGYSKIQKCACGAIGAVRSLALQLMLNAITRHGFRIYVAATGNEFNSSRFNDPAGFSDAVAVGSVNDSDYRSQYSNYGTTNHPCYVLAPGGEENPVKTVTEDVGTCGTSPGNPCYGTSVAAAYAAGMLALLRSDKRHKADTRDQFLKALSGYCRMPAHASASATEYGRGILQYVPPSNSKGDVKEKESESNGIVDEGDQLLIGRLRIPKNRGC